MRWTLRNQILTPLLAVAAASLLGVGALHAWLATRAAQQHVDQQLRSIAGVLASTNFPLTDAVLKQLGELAGAELILTDSAGRTLAASGSLVSPEISGWGSAEDFLDSGPRQTVMVAGRSYFLDQVPIGERPGVAAGAELHVLLPRDAYRRAWRQAFLPPLGVGVAAAAATAAAASWVGRRVSRAVSRLEDELQRIAAGDNRPAPLCDRDDELRDLGLAVNRMAAMLGEHQERLRRSERRQTAAALGAGLAHELRNWATGCRLALDLHAERCPGGAEQEALIVARRQLQLIDNGLQRFLRTASSEIAADESKVREPCDLNELLAELTSLIEPLARHADVSFAALPAAAPMIVSGDVDALRHASANLLLNAVEAARQSPDDGRREVSIRLEQGPQSARMIVVDTGPGPPADIAARIFEPFVTTKREGVGLGLAVALRTARDHDGSLVWRREVEQTVFVMEVPRTP